MIAVTCGTAKMDLQHARTLKAHPAQRLVRMWLRCSGKLHVDICNGHHVHVVALLWETAPRQMQLSPCSVRQCQHRPATRSHSARSRPARWRAQALSAPQAFQERHACPRTASLHSCASLTPASLGPAAALASTTSLCREPPWHHGARKNRPCQPLHLSEPFLPWRSARSAQRAAASQTRDRVTATTALPNLLASRTN